MGRYEKVVLDFETTGLSSLKDEILQVSAIDQCGNVLINEYCKPKNLDEYCRSTRKPMLQQHQYGPFKGILLSKTRCKEIKKPVSEGEEIYAFLRVMNGYCALYYRNIE